MIRIDDIKYTPKQAASFFMLRLLQSWDGGGGCREIIEEEGGYPEFKPTDKEADKIDNHFFKFKERFEAQLSKVAYK